MGMKSEDFQTQLKDLTPEKRQLFERFINELLEENGIETVSVGKLIQKNNTMDVSSLLSSDLDFKDNDILPDKKEKFENHIKDYQNRKVSLYQSFKQFQKRAKFKFFFNQRKSYYKNLSILLLTTFFLTSFLSNTINHIFIFKANTSLFDFCLNLGVCFIASAVFSIFTHEKFRASKNNAFLSRSWLSYRPKTIRSCNQFNNRTPFYHPDAPMVDSSTNKEWVYTCFLDERIRPIILDKLKDGTPLTMDDVLFINHQKEGTP